MAVLGTANALASETVDRVVAGVGRTAITASDVKTEYRFEYFLEHARVPASAPDRATFERVRDQLIDRELVSREVAAGDMNPPALSSSDSGQWAELVTKSGDESGFTAALHKLGMSEAEFAARMAARQTALETIDQFLRPLASVSSQDIETYYRQTFLPELAKNAAGEAPQLADVQNQIHEILVQKRINDMLPDWLQSLRTSHQVEIYPFE